MPQIIINEVDKTKAGLTEYSNYTVVIPGFRAVHYGIDDPEGDPSEYFASFDENKIFECSSPLEFEKKVGKVAPKAIPWTIGEDYKETYKGIKSVIIPAHYGNQMAYELLKLGLKVLYVDMGEFIAPTPIGEEDPGSQDNANAKIYNQIKALGTPAFWAALSDKANYDFRFVTHGLLNGDNIVPDASESKVSENPEVPIANTIDLANGQISMLTSFNPNARDIRASRGDCIALLELNEDSYTAAKEDPVQTIRNIEREINGLSVASDGKFSTITVPSVCYASKAMKSDLAFGGNNKMPASFHYLACFATMIGNNIAEWYAAAGYARGVASLAIESTSLKLGEAAIAALEPRATGGDTRITLSRACNIIANFRGNYYLWGNRTAYRLGNELVASHFLNIRNLCTTIKKQLYSACRRFTFNPNSDVLWINFCDAITPTLDKMKADQGLFDYQIIKEKATKKATLKAKIRIIPIEAVEDFDLEISLEDSFGDSLEITE